METRSKAEILAICDQMCKNTLMETLDITFTDVGPAFLVASMPVTSKVHQPDGILHGGATVALAESVGSAASYLFLNAKEVKVRGIEIAANHIKSVKEGRVHARATFLHKGKTTQVWDIRVTNDAGALISFVKLTTLSLPR